MDLFINTLEIAVLIILPLIIFFKGRSWNIRSHILTIVILYLIWYLTYALLHESFHMLGVWISGKEIFDYQLIPHFWEGQWGVGYINYDFQGDLSDFFIISLPYLRDLLFIIIGFLILRKRMPQQPFVAGLIQIILVLSPLFDLSNNYIAYLFGNLNDFNAIKLSSNGIISHFIGISFIAISIYLTLKTIIISKTYTETQK